MEERAAEIESLGTSTVNQNAIFHVDDSFPSDCQFEDIFFMDHEDVMICLICMKALRSKRKYNIQRHYDKQHSKIYGTLNKSERLIEMQRLKAALLCNSCEANSVNEVQQPDIKHEEEPQAAVQEQCVLPFVKQEPESCDVPETKCFVSELDHVHVKEEGEFVPDVLDFMKSELKCDEGNIKLQDDKTGAVSDKEQNHCYSFNLNPKVMVHTNVLTGELTYFCCRCKKSFSHDFYSNNHECICRDDTVYTCNTYNKTCTQREGFLGHPQNHKGITNVHDISNKELIDKRTLIQIKLNLSRKLKQYTCKICNAVFQKENLLRSHVRAHESHKVGCEICDKTFFAKSDLKKHMNIHTGNRPFECDMCDKSFRQKNHLIIHQRRHTGSRPYLCEYCGKTFYKQGDLVSHLRIHKGIRSYICDNCNKSFHNKHGLLEHMITHTDSRPFVCEICNKAFNRKDNLRIHKFLHQKDQPYVCVLCKKGFSQRRTLRKHMLIH